MEDFKNELQAIPSFVWVLLCAVVILAILSLIHLKEMNDLLNIMKNENNLLSKREEAGHELLRITCNPFFIEEVRKTAEDMGSIELSILARDRFS